MRSVPQPFWLLIGAFILFYVLTFPQFIFSIDELSYLGRAMALADGHSNWLQTTISGNTFSWSPAAYPLGTSFFASWFALIHPSLIFLSGLFYLTFAFYLVHHILKNEKLNNALAYCIALLFLPTVYFSRGLMSEMPSLLLVAVFVYILFKKQNTYLKYIWLGLLTGLSFWFRETNLLLFGSLVGISLLKNPRYIPGFILAMAIGLLPRFLSAFYFYEQVAYVKQYAPFGWQYFSKNLLLYLIILIVLLPGGLYVLYHYRGRFANSIKLSLLTFTALHLVYEYNSGDHSGFMISLFYNGRYYIPTLPLWMILYAYFAQQYSFFNKKIIQNGLVIMTILFITSSQLFFGYLEKQHRNVAKEIFTDFNHKPIIYDHTAYRYLNPSQGTINQLESLEDLKTGKAKLSQKAVLILSHRNNSDRQLEVWENHLYHLQHLKSQLSIRELKKYTIFDGTNVIVFELNPI